MASPIKCSHVKINDGSVVTAKGTYNLDPGVESKFEEFKYDIVSKIDKELDDSMNTREFISQKYDELCSKIQCLTELDSTVSGFRSDVKSIEKQIADLSARVDEIEKRSLCKDCPSFTSSAF